MDFYNNKNNDTLKFKLNTEGVDKDKIETRLILTSKEKNYLLYGKVKENICTFDIPELNLYENNTNGEIKFEIISNDLYFRIWEDIFEVKSNKNKLSKLHRELSRKQKDSSNKYKARIKLAKFNEKLNNKKEYYLHSVTNQLLSENQLNGMIDR